MTVETTVLSDDNSVPLFLRDCWYLGAHAANIRRGRLQREMMLGEPVLIGRMRDGQAFAPSNIRVRSYPVCEQDGLIWVYMAANPRDGIQPRSQPPKVSLRHATP